MASEYVSAVASSVWRESDDVGSPLSNLIGSVVIAGTGLPVGNDEFPSLNSADINPTKKKIAREGSHDRISIRMDVSLMSAALPRNNDLLCLVQNGSEKVEGGTELIISSAMMIPGIIYRGRRTVVYYRYQPVPIPGIYRYIRSPAYIDNYST